MGKRTSKLATADTFRQTETTNTLINAPATDVVANNGALIVATPVVTAKSYVEHCKIIEKGLLSVKKAFFDIAFALEWIDTNQAYSMSEYKDIVEFAKKQYGIGRSSTYNYLNIVRRFGERNAENGEIKSLKSGYKNYSPTQLLIMLDATDEEIETCHIKSTMTCAQIKSLIKSLHTIEDSKADSGNAGTDFEDSETENFEAESSEPEIKESKTGNKQYSKKNNLLTIKSLDDFEKCKDSIFELIKKTLSQDGLQCAVSINMEWN